MMARTNPTWYAFVRWLVRVTFFNCTGGIRSLHQERVPMTGGLIVAPLHVSHVDPPAIACGTKRRLNFMAKEELFRGPFGKIIASVGAFPVKRGEGDTESIRKAMSLLEAGEAVLIFPEGTRGDGRTMLPINRGVAMMAKRTNAQVLPVGVIGTHLVWPRGRSKPSRHLIVLNFGEPFRYSDVATRESEKENRQAFATELQRRIVALCNEAGMNLRSDDSSSHSPSASRPEPIAEGPASGPESAQSPH